MQAGLLQTIYCVAPFPTSPCRAEQNRARSRHLRPAERLIAMHVHPSTRIPDWVVAENEAATFAGFASPNPVDAHTLPAFRAFKSLDVRSQGGATRRTDARSERCPFYACWCRSCCGCATSQPPHALGSIIPFRTIRDDGAHTGEWCLPTLFFPAGTLDVIILARPLPSWAHRTLHRR